jgi:hypothetical protein
MWQTPALLSPLRFAAPHLEERFSLFAFQMLLTVLECNVHHAGLAAGQA